MIIIIPIGGIGKRFKDNGYKKPKALINIFGKPILYYLLDSLDLTNIDYIYIPYNLEYKKYRFEDLLKKDYPNIKFKFYCLENNTRGAAETINIAIKNLLEDKRDKPVICLDSDSFYLENIIKKWKGKNCIFSFKSNNKKPIYSYVKTDNNNKILDIKEKEKISNNACSGAYAFESIDELEKYTSKIIENNIRQKSEFYTSGVIKEMLKDNIEFKNITIDINKFVCLGTPIQLRLFYNNFPKINCLNSKNLISSKRICFDLDNTLVTVPTIKGDYSSVEPITKNIELLRYLKKFDNTIIIYTARRMRTHKGNIGKINADIGKLTFETLEKFNIPYDEIYFGKPYADYYIDDLAVNAFDDLEKEIGYYNCKIEPRNFNKIDIKSIEIITKSGKDISGEIYYYQNIPNQIKDLFPLSFNYENNKFNLEKIDGITLSNLYLSELLTNYTLECVFNSLCRIQKCKISNKNEENINIYDNYSKKLIKRYKSYNYSKFKNSEEIFNNINENLLMYEKKKLGIKKVIHGDPVFTNIIINKYDKIKFIDMRGKINNKLTIYGDWLYDWSKIYQSLIGYDEILLSKTLAINYKNEKINIFKNFFISKFGKDYFEYLKIITKSHLFSLIPLHDNDKCIDYFNLILSDYLL